MNRLIEVVTPARLGTDFRRLMASSVASNAADGISLAAAPLLMAAQTRDPLLIAAAGLLLRLPWLLLGVYAGVVADRFDRRLILVAANAFRAVMLVLLTVSVASGTINIGIVLATLFLLGVAETLADTTAGTLLPMIIDRDDLGIGNSRLVAAHMTVNQLVGPPIGAALFLVGMALPFGLEAVLLAYAAVVVSRMTIVRSPATEEQDQQDRRVLAEIRAGVRWLWTNPPIRTLALTIVAFNVTFGAAFAVLVLYSLERLQMGEVGFGLLTSASAVGGVIGASSYGRLERRFSLADLMRAGLIIETLTHLGLALTSTPIVALVIMFLFGAHASVWGTTSTSIRQRAVPEEFQGRVGSVYMTGVHGGIVVGSALGGIIADVWGVTGPYWFAFGGSLILVVVLWRELEHIAHAE
ncbi:MAG: MFS transporter [Actinomycetota bacterium]